MPHKSSKKPSPIATTSAPFDSGLKTLVKDTLPPVPRIPPLPKAAPYAQLPEYKAVKLAGTYREIFDNTPPPPLNKHYGRTESSYSYEFLDVAELVPTFSVEKGKIKASGIEKAYYLLRVQPIVYIAEWDPPPEATAAEKEEWERFILLVKTLHEQGHVDIYNKLVGKHFFETKNVSGYGVTEEMALSDLYMKIKALGQKDLAQRWASAEAESKKYDAENGHGETQNCILKASP